MAYIDYDYYKSLYGKKAITEADFNCLSWDACRRLDMETSGIDGVRKLKVAFPTDADNAEIVKRCVCKLIEVASSIETAKTKLASIQGFIQREDGTVVNKLVSSVSAGNESVSYVTNNSLMSLTDIDKAALDANVEKQMYRNIITEYLSGVVDANGVNLLYMGRYPYRVEE